MSELGDWRRVASLAELDDEYPKQVVVDGVEIALCIVEGSVYAVGNICSHAFARLADGHLENGNIVCPLHQGSFDVRTGAAAAAPCSAPIMTYDTNLSGTKILIRIPPSAG